MAICGFCKKEVELGRYMNEKKRTPITVVVEFTGKTRMFSCPHCDSILGFLHRGKSI